MNQMKQLKRLLNQKMQTSTLPTREGSSTKAQVLYVNHTPVALFLFLVILEIGDFDNLTIDLHDSMDLYYEIGYF